jgi:predicted short-subunit dehydrogenase-like oxidoreductase (DUF2520 family)
MGASGPIAILGLGAVGMALARGLTEGGLDVRVWSRRAATRRRAQRALADQHGASSRVARTPAEACKEGRVVLLCLPEAVVPRFLEGLRLPEGPVVLLTVSGAAALTSLAGPRFQKGKVLGRFHPLCPVLAREGAEAFVGMPFGIEGPPRARSAARRLCKHLRGQALELTGADPGGYHGGAALLGGGLVALHALAQRAMIGAVRSPTQLAHALHAFVLRNADNVAHFGPAAALTGPIARGAEENVHSNLRALARVPRGAEVYRALGLVMADLAERRSGAPPAGRARIRRLLARAPSARH